MSFILEGCKGEIDMFMHNDNVAGYQPLLLLRNVSYPNYQLYAIAGRGKQPEIVLTIAVLETLKWLSQRFRDFELPTELNVPDVSHYSEFDCSKFSSFRIGVGYKVEVVWLSEEKVWALQLTEPDLGPQPGVENQSRPPVPGRIFETNIAYRIIDNQVECGFCTMVSEPVGTTAICEVFRLAFIKHLACNPLVGLWQQWQLIDTHYLLNVSTIRSLKDWLGDRDRMMPVVIIVEYAPELPILLDLPLITDKVSMTSLISNPPSRLIPSEISQIKDSRLPFDISGLTRYGMGYAQFFVLPFIQRDSFQGYTEKAIGGGDILLFEPAVFGGEVKYYSYSRTKENPEAIFDQLEEYIQNYQKRKPMTYGNIIFLPDAKIMERDKVLNLNHTKEEILNAFEEKQQSTEIRHRNQLLRLEEQCDLKDKKIRCLDEKIRASEDNAKLLREQKNCLVMGYQTQLATKDNEINRLNALNKRPVSPKEVAVWVESYLTDKLFFHKRACDLMNDLAPNTVDLRLLCDALEFLATDYRDELLGLIDEVEMRQRCTRKYGRPFDVTPLRGTSLNRYPGDYKIKYYIGYNGKPVESLLDLHLRVGNTGENILRIYFLYDKEKKLIVIGSLPHHLPTVSE